MGKVKESASAWPPVSQGEPNVGQHFQPCIQDTTAFNTPNSQFFVPGSSSYQFQNFVNNDPQPLKANYDLVMKELEQELFTRNNIPNSNAGLNQMIISQYLALLEQQNQLQNYSYSAPVNQHLQVMDTEMFSPPSTPSTSSSISTPRSSASSTPVSSPPMSPRSSFSMPRTPIHIQQIALQAQQNQHLMPPVHHSQSVEYAPNKSDVPSEQLAQDSHLLNPLTPLSSGGFIYNFPGIPGSPQPFSPFMPVQTQSFTSTINPVSPAIAVKQEKLEKYRQKKNQEEL